METFIFYWSCTWHKFFWYFLVFLFNAIPVDTVIGSTDLELPCCFRQHLHLCLSRPDGYHQFKTFFFGGMFYLSFLLFRWGQSICFLFLVISSTKWSTNLLMKHPLTVFLEVCISKSRLNPGKIPVKKFVLLKLQT